MADQSKRFCLFNSDKTYDLKIVEDFLLVLEEKYGFKISVDRLYFGLARMAEMCETTIPTLPMDFAIFVVHANESRLSINEENAGIGYARLYRALLQKTDDKVLIVIGGDTYYRDEDEKERCVISRWVRRKVSSQFREEYLDGRRSFIFSWDQKHRPIHVEALLHFFDPGKRGSKFEYTPKPKPLPRPKEPDVTPAPLPRDARQEAFVVHDDQEILIKDDEETGTRRRSFSDREGQKRELRGDLEEASYGAISADVSGTSADDYPAGTVLLETNMRYGKISYQHEDVLRRKARWRPSQKIESDLMGDWGSIPLAKVKFTSDGYGGVGYDVGKATPGYCTRLKNCLLACILGLVHCFGVLWGWILGLFRR